MMEIPVHDRSGTVVETIQFDESCLGKAVYRQLLHQAVVMYEANRRVGSGSSKTRAEVMGTTAKPWRQKGTGRARVGNKRNPVWRSGGVAHGPKPRDFSKRMSRKMRRQALKSALLAKLRDGELKVVTDFSLEAPRTREVAGALKALGADRGALVVVREYDPIVWKSTRNLRRVEMAPLKELNAHKALLRKTVIMTKEAFTAIPEEIA